MDLLALIAAEPTLLPLWAVLLVAAGMYPVGMMFGCSPCCGRQCNHCTGTLPETLTVAIDGIPESHPGDPLITLSFSGCGGYGGGGIATAPGQSALDSDPADDRGPISAVSITDGGSGYAQLGRAAPSVSASVATYYGGSGAVLDVTLTKAKDSCGLDYWAVNKITVVDGGEGYSIAGVSFQVAEGDTERWAASAEITLEQPPPEATLAINALSGSGAGLSPPVFASGYEPGTYYIDSVAVEDGGDGYTHLDEIELTLTKGELYSYYSSAVFSLITANTKPAVSVSGGSGSGAVLKATLSAGTSSNGSPVWSVSSIAIESAGSGYAFLDALSVTVDDGDPRSGGCSVYVWSVDGSGGITSVYIFDGGQYFKGGPVTGVAVWYGGNYRGPSTGKIASVTVTDGGIYFREDASLPPYVADVTVTVNQTEPSAGTGAVISATVGDDPQDPETFGKVTGLTIENGGDGYLAYLLRKNCLARFSGRSFVLKQEANFPCSYVWECGQNSPCDLDIETVKAELPFSFEIPNGAPIRVSVMLQELRSPGPFLWVAGGGTFSAREMAPNCATIDVTAYGTLSIPPEATARVTAGGTYEEPEACKQFTVDDVGSIYGEINWGGVTRTANFHLGCGHTSSLSFGPGPLDDSDDTTGEWCDQWKAENPATNSECAESRSVRDRIHGSLRKSHDCQWRWEPTDAGPAGTGRLCVWIDRSLWVTGSGPYGPETFLRTRSCRWCWPYEFITDEETLFPIGVVFGDNVEFVSVPEPWVVTGIPVYQPGGLLGTDTVCDLQNPGKPTVTLSALP